MMPTIVNADSALEALSRNIGLSPPKRESEWHIWLAEYLRKICAMYCPLPRGRLLGHAEDLLSGIVDISRDRIEDALDSLFNSSDLIELPRVLTLNDQYSGDWIFLGPPSYCIRESGTVYISGIAPDDFNFVPQSIEPVLQKVGAFRFIQKPSSEIITALNHSGLREVKSSLLEVIPSKISATEYVVKAREKLVATGADGDSSSIRVCVPGSRNSKNYRERWKGIGTESGLLIFRRPRMFGAEAWYLGEFENGVLQRQLELPWLGDRVRGCDSAWRLQLALDKTNSAPATYVASISGETVSIRFSFPLPLWAQRRFSVPIEGNQPSPFLGFVRKSEWEEERRVIEEILWYEMT